MAKDKVKDENKVVEERKEIDNLKNQLARALADYDNLRKRVEKEREIWMTVASQATISKLLPVLDTLETAQAHLADQGLAIAISQFKDTLKEEGLEEIKPNKEDDFDHEIHEAVESAEAGKAKKGKIAEVILTGWKFKEGPVVRYAKVKVFG